MIVAGQVRDIAAAGRCGGLTSVMTRVTVMRVTSGWVRCLVLLISAQTACHNGVEPTPVGYAGEWIGTTAQGTPVRFSVSGNVVTSISITYNFSPACADTLSYTS